MSLIDEALKRAQAAEPARRGEPGRDSPGLPAPIPVPLPDSRRAKRRGPLFALAVAAGAALAFGGIWLARRRSATPVAGPQQTLVAPAQQVLPAAPPAPPKRELARPREASKPSRKPPAARAAGAAPDQRSVPTSESGLPREPSVADRGGQEKPGEPASPAPARRNYVGEARLPGGLKIELGGIVYSEDRPVALLNGRILGPGSSVEGFTVVEILENRVELRGADRTIFITLK